MSFRPDMGVGKAPGGAAYVQPGSELLRNYPESETKTYTYNTDEHLSVVPEDTIMYLNLQMLDMPAALLEWPEFKDMPFTISEDMFVNPNRRAMHVVIYFLMANLVGREATKKHFKACWPPTSMACVRDFKNRAVELIKEHGRDWEIAPEKLSCLGAMLQRHAGLKMVELLCGLSHMSLVKRYKELHPEDTLLLESVQDPLKHLEGQLGELDKPEVLAKMVINAGKSKVAIQQKAFLHSIKVLKSMQHAHSAAVGRVLEEHAYLSNEAAGQAHTTDLIRQHMEKDDSQNLRHVLENGRGIEAVVDQVVDMDVPLQRALGGACADAYCISQRTFGSESCSGQDAVDVKDTGLTIQDSWENGGDLKKCYNRNVQQVLAREGSISRQVLDEPASLLGVLKPPDGHLRTHLFSEQHKSTENVLCGSIDFSTNCSSKASGPPVKDRGDAPTMVLTDVMAQWHRSLRDLQVSMGLVGRNRQAQNLLSDVANFGSSGSDENSACEVLEENLTFLKALKHRIVTENTALDQEIATAKEGMKPLVKEVVTKRPSKADFVLKGDVE